MCAEGKEVGVGSGAGTWAEGKAEKGKAEAVFRSAYGQPDACFPSLAETIEICLEAKVRVSVQSNLGYRLRLRVTIRSVLTDWNSAVCSLVEPFDNLLGARPAVRVSP
jgi:hypothetical protein